MTTTGARASGPARFMELEPRLMFDGAAVATVVEAAADTAEAVRHPASDVPEPTAHPVPEHDGEDVAEALLALGAPAAGAESARQVVIVDGAVGDKDAILDAIPAGTAVYVLPTDGDGVAVIADILAQHRDLDAVHVVSHGEDGGVLLGSATLDADSAASHAQALARWGDSLSTGGDILLYGCATGSGAEGLAFIQTLRDLTGADVAASADATGAADRGGDWDLESAAGTIEAQGMVAERFAGLLVATPVDGRANFGSEYNISSFGAPFTGTFTSTNLGDRGWIASLTAARPSGGFLFVGNGGSLTFGGWASASGANDGLLGDARLRTASGNEIDILQITVDANVTGTLTITGFRDGNAVSGCTSAVSVTREPHDTVPVTLAWKDVDEIRFSLPISAPTDNTQIHISEMVTGPVPTLSGSVPDAANAIVEGADAPLNLSTLAFAHGGVASTNLTITANGGTLSATGSGGVTVTGSGTGGLTLTGSAADIDAWLNGAANITYNSGAMSGSDALRLSFSTSLMGVTVDHGTRTVDVTAADQPARFKALSDSFAGRVGIAKTLDFSSADLIDADSESAAFQLTMSVDSGMLSVGGGTISGLTVTGSGTNTLVFSGPPYLVESWFNDASRPITYTGVTEGTAVLTLRGSDTDTGAYSIGTVDIAVAPPNTAPTVSGIPSLVTLTEDAAGTLDLSGMVISDPDSPGIFTITIEDRLLDIAAPSAAGVTATALGTRAVSLTGSVTALTAYLADANRVSLTPQANASGMNYTSITVTVDDGDDNVVTNTIRVDVTPVDDPSSLIGANGSLIGIEDTAKGLSLAHLSLVDRDQGPQTVILTVEHGTLSMANVSQLTVTGDGTDRLTVTGSVFFLNEILLKRASNYLRYTPEADLYGTAADALTISSPGAAGAEDVVLRRIDIDVTGVNDAPTLTGLPTVLVGQENQATPLDLSALVLSDIDSAGPGFRLTVVALSGGYLSAMSTDAVTVAGSGTRMLYVDGRLADIQAWLTSGTPITFQGRPNVSGTNADTIQFQGSDGDGANVALGTVAVTIDPGTGPDVPTLSGAPSRLNAIEETPASFDLSGITLTNGGAAPGATMTLDLSVGHGILAVTSAGAATVSGAGTTTLSITGIFADIQAWLTSATAVTYTPNLDVAGNNADALAIRITDGAGADHASIGAVSISISNVNDAPAPTGFPTRITAATNTAKVLDLSGLKINDPDATIISPAPGNMTAVLTVTSGTLTYMGGPPGFAVSGAGTTSLTLTAPIKTVEAFLNSGRVTYTPPTDAHGQGVATLTLVVDDGAGSGDVPAGSATIDVAPPNAAPTLSGLPGSVSGVEDTGFAVDLSAAALADGDSPGADFVLTLAADAGTLAAASTGTVTVAGSGSGRLTLTGTMTAINGFLGNATAITCTGASNAHGTGAATLTLTADDGDGNANVALGTVRVDLTNVDDPPGADAVPTRVTAIEDAKTGLDLSGLVLSTIDPVDADHALTISVDTGTLFATASGGVTVIGSGSKTLTLQGGRDALQAWLAVSGSVSYQGTENLAGTGVATLTVKADDMDGSGEVTLGTIAVDVTPVNDAPTGSGLPTAVTGTEGQARSIDLSGLTLADIDSPDAGVVLSLSTDYGTLAATSGHGVTVSGSGGAALALTGTVADINAFLDRSGAVALTTAAGTTGTGLGTLTVTVDDHGGSGAVALGTVSIDVRPPNAAPTMTGLPAFVAGTEDTGFAVDLSGVALADVDSPGGAFVLTLAVDVGILAATSTGAVTVAGSGTATLTLTGSVDGINGFLGTATAITYTGAANAYGTGAATLTVTADDGDGNAGVALGTLRIDLTEVNDPAGVDALPARVTATEDVKTGLDLTGVVLSKIDPTDADHTVTFVVDKGTLYGTMSGGVIVAGSGTASLTLWGNRDAIQSWLAVNGNVSYLGPANLAGSEAATLTVRTNDLDGTDIAQDEITVGTIAVDITPVNDAPTGSGLPATVTGVEGQARAIDLSGLTLADIDSPGAGFALTLGTDYGTLAATSGYGVTVSGSGGTTLTLTGTVGDITAFLDRSGAVALTTAAGTTGTGLGTLTVAIDDHDGSGAVALGTVSIDVRPPNADPAVTGLPTAVTALEDIASALDLSGMTLSDVDSPDDDFVLTLAVDAGTLRATGGAGVTIGGSGSATLTLTGTVTAIDAFLDSSAAVTYTGATNAFGTGTATLTVTANDHDGSGAVTLGTVRVDVTAVDDAPTATGLPGRVTMTEDVPGTIDLSGLTLADVDPADADFALVLSTEGGSLSAASAGGVTVTGAGSRTLTVSGSMTAVQAWLRDAGRLTYTGAADAAGTGADRLSVSGDDLDGSGVVRFGSVTIDISGVNDAPSAGGLPASVTATEDLASAIDLSGLTLSDADGDAGFGLTLSVDAGTLGATSGGGVTVGGAGTGTLTLTGTPDALNAFLDARAVTYTGAADAFGSGAATLTVTADDNRGGGTLAVGTVRIDITPANDGPTLSGLADRMTVTEDVPTALDLSGTILADVDPADGDFALVLSVTAGRLSATGADGVAVTGSGSGSVTVTGSLAAVQAWLSVPGRVVYTGAPDAAGIGRASLSVTIDDRDGSGPVRVKTVALDITGVDDAPRFDDLPEGTTARTNQTGPLDLGTLRLVDVDGGGDTLTVALQVDAGRLSATSADGVVVSGSGSGTLVLMGSPSAIEAFLRQSRVSFDPGGEAGEARLALMVADGAASSTASMAIQVEAVAVAVPVPSPPATGAPAPAPAEAPTPAPTAGPEATDTPVSLAIQGALAGAGTGEVASAILGRLGSVSAIDTSGTPVGQAIRLQSQSPRGGGPGGATGFDSAGRGGFTGDRFGGLGSLGRTGGFGDAEGLEDIGPPTVDGPGPPPPAEPAATAEGHRGLRWQMAAARAAAREPVAATTRALEDLAARRTG